MFTENRLRLSDQALWKVNGWSKRLQGVDVVCLEISFYKQTRKARKAMKRFIELELQ